MKKFILPILLLVFPIIFASVVMAATLEVSRSASFASSDLNFSGGETVYVRTNADSDGSKSHVLNIRDNNYTIVESVNLAKSDSSYSAGFAVPSNEGYYSLEAKIEGNGSSAVSVKTIKVGSPTNANVKVNVNSSVKGTKSSDKSDNSEGQSVGKPEASDKSDKMNSEKASDDVQTFSADQKAERKSFVATVWDICRGIWNFVKFF